MTPKTNGASSDLQVDRRWWVWVGVAIAIALIVASVVIWLLVDRIASLKPDKEPPRSLEARMTVGSRTDSTRTLP